MGKLVDERESFDAMMRETFGTPPAVRQLDVSLIRDPGFQRRYAAETGVLRGLDEPWVAVTTSFVVDGAGRIVATMRPQISGPSLAVLLERNPHGLDAQTTAAIAMDVLSALSALHARGVAHRGDLVEHVIVSPDGTCVLVDEGLAPRWTNESTEAAVAADLRSFADLVTRCLGGRAHSRRGRPNPPRIVKTASGGTGLASRLPRPTANPLRPLATRAAALPTPGTDAAALLLTELGAAAARAFEPDWDMRARERLAHASRTFVAAPPPPPTFPALPAPEPTRSLLPVPPPPRSGSGSVSISISSSLWPLPRPVRFALVAAALIGVTVSFLFAVRHGNANTSTSITTSTPQANAIPATSAAAASAGSASGSLDSSASPSASGAPSASASASPSVPPSPTQAQSGTTTPRASNPGVVAPTTATSRITPPVVIGGVVNPGFETGTLLGWSCSGTDSVITSPIHSGNFALQGAVNNSDYAQCSQTVNVTPGTKYTLTGWVNGAYVFLGVMGTGTSDADTWTQGTNGSYSHLSVGFSTGNSTTSVTIYVHGWYAQGTYYADDISVS